MARKSSIAARIVLLLWVLVFLPSLVVLGGAYYYVTSYAPAQQPPLVLPLRNVLGGVLLVEGLWFLFVLRLLLRRLVRRPLLALVGATGELTEGNLSVRAPVKGQGEVGEAVDSFNTMTETLERRIRWVNEQMERYSDLDARAKETRDELSRVERAHATELKKLNDRIEHELRERRGTEQALKAVTGKLHRFLSEHEEFVYVASHDLQEPLRMVANYTKLLDRRYGSSLDERAHEYISFAAKGAERMQKLISGLLKYSRVTTRGKEFAPLSMTEAFDHAIGNLQLSIQDSGAQVTRDELPTVMADDVQIAQLFQNLIGNAVKFHRPDVPPRVHVSGRREEDRWLFSVQDNGIGIAKENIERVFVIFQRLHTEDEFPGTGIGLAICRRIVERHNGDIWIESAEGKGSTFFFTMPVMREKAA